MSASSLPPAALLEHAVFVRRLAYHLLRDDAAADDAAQETLARAMERPPRPGPGVRAWLAAVLRNVVRMGARSGRRRRAREVARGGASEISSAADVAARSEVLRAVASAVAALDTPQREVVLLRHYDGLPPREIAARLGVPLATVKSRLSRAHERLRRLLDEGRRGNVEGWRCALIGCAGGDFARRLPIASKGALAVGTTTKVGAGALVLLLLAGGAWHVASDSGASDSARVPLSTPDVGREVTASPPTSGLVGRPEGEGEHAAGAPPAATATKAQTPADLDAYWESLRTPVAAGRVEGIVVEGSRPVGGGRARLWEQPAGWFVSTDQDPGTPAATAELGADGTFAMSDLPPGIYTIEVAPNEGSRLFTSVGVTRAPQTGHRIVAVLGSFAVRGRVFDRLGRPASGIVVNVAASPDRYTTPQAFFATATTGEDGAFRFGRLPSAGPYLISALLGPDPVTQGTRSGVAPRAVDGVSTIDLGSDRAEPFFAGVVKFAGGDPARGPFTLWLHRPASMLAEERIEVDAEGRFGRRVPVGTYDADLEVGPDHRRISAAGPVTVEDERFHEIALRGTRLRVTVRRTKDGSLLPCSLRTPITLSAAGRGPRSSSVTLTCVEDGLFVVEGVLPGTYSIQGPFLSLRLASGEFASVTIPADAREVSVEVFTPKSD